MDASAAAPVLRLVGEVCDPRRHNRVHPLPPMSVMAVLAVMCGATGGRRRRVLRSAPALAGGGLRVAAWRSLRRQLRPRLCAAESRRTGSGDPALDGGAGIPG